MLDEHPDTFLPQQRHGPFAYRKVAAKKPSSAPAAIKPVKQTLTKSALINLLAEENEIPRKTAVGVYTTLENLFLGSVHPRGVGEFVLPGLLKVNLRKVPARKSARSSAILQRGRW